jgi:hypothetical protein
MSRTRLTSAAFAATVAVAAGSAPGASADATLQSPDGHAACIAQAWVPANTDPTVPPGSIGQFLSSTKFGAGGGLRQDNGKDC